MKKDLKLGIAIYQIVGSVIGIILSIIGYIITISLNDDITIINTAEVNVVNTTVLLLVCTLAGILLITKEVKTGINLSIFVQILQIPCFAIGSFTYIYNAGLQLGLQFGYTIPTNPNFIGARFTFGLLFNLFSGSSIYLSSANNIFFVGINIVPFIVIKYLLKLKEEIIINEIKGTINNKNKGI